MDRFETHNASSKATVQFEPESIKWRASALPGSTI